MEILIHRKASFELWMLVVMGLVGLATFAYLGCALYFLLITQSHGFYVFFCIKLP